MAQAPGYIIKVGSVWFNGFVSVHPGTEPRGHLEPRFDTFHALVIETAEGAKVATEDLREMMPMTNPIVYRIEEIEESA